MSIIEIQETVYDTNELDYIVFVVDTVKTKNFNNYLTCSDKEFIEESLNQQYFYSLKDFQREFNREGGMVNQYDDYIRILPIGKYLEVMMRKD